VRVRSPHGNSISRCGKRVRKLMGVELKDDLRIGSEGAQGFPRAHCPSASSVSRDMEIMDVAKDHLLA
jgi:hypothetical protein